MDAQGIRRLVIVALLLAIAIAPALCQNSLNSDYGETWIRWDWTVNSTQVNVYVDGVLVKTNTTQTYYQLVNLNPKELHSIAVYNGSSGDLLIENESMTMISTTILYFWLIIILALIILMIILSDMKLRIAVGVLVMAFIIYDIILSVGNGGFSLIAYAMAAFVGYFMIMAFWDLFKEQMKWT